VNGDDLLTAAEAAKALGISVERLESLKWRLPCEITLGDRSVRVRRRDLPAWREALGLEAIERRKVPVPTGDDLDAMRRKLVAAGAPSDPIVNEWGGDRCLLRFPKRFTTDPRHRCAANCAARNVSTDVPEDPGTSLSRATPRS
jgi:hypothetical protein